MFETDKNNNIVLLDAKFNKDPSEGMEVRIFRRKNEVEIQCSKDGVITGLVPSQKYSEAFEIGYQGAGPAEAAYRILEHFGNCENFQQFKREVIANIGLPVFGLHIIKDETIRGYL